MTNLATASNAVPQRAAARINLAQVPGARQLLLLVGIAAAVAVGVAIVLWSRSPSYALLYANLDEKDAAQVVQALQAAGEPYQLGGSGGSVFVPSSDIASLRLKLAAQGLPRGSAESAAAAADSPFGMSDFAEKARYQQSLENDLANTIASLQSVKGARVHLALPKTSAFIRDRRPASASVVVTLYPGRRLDASQVGAIVHLVASSVPDLDPRQVSVIDQQGQLLTAGDGGSAADVADSRFRLMQSVEDAYAARVEELLTPLVGAGRVRAQVVADMDFTETEKTSEIFDHDKPALRSEQVSSEQRRDGGGGAQGIPGALSNQPPSTPAQPTAANPAVGAAAPPAAATAQTAEAAPTESNSSATRNYELDRTISHTRAPVGAIRRLTVAVVVDNKQAVDADGNAKSTPIGKAELAQMTELVKNAVGFDATRGDSVSVVNVPFHTEPAADVPGTPLLSRPGVRDMIKQGLGALVLLVLMFGVLRPLFRSLVGPAAPRRAAPPPALPAAEEPAPDRLTLGAAPAGAQAPLDYDQKVTLAKRMVSQDPKQVAQVVKSWVAEDGG